MPIAAAGKMQALYGAAQYSTAVSNHIANSQRDLQTLIDILQGKVSCIRLPWQYLLWAAFMNVGLTILLQKSCAAIT